MNAKEKAKELVDKFKPVANCYILERYYEAPAYEFCEATHLKNAKQCAIISVNGEVESITILSLLCNFDNKMKPILEEKIKELNEVKTEIQNL